MQHTHISQTCYLPGLATDSALHYPTLPKGPPLATLAPTNIQLSDICELLVNQKPAKPLSQLEILEIMFLLLMPRSESKLKLQNHLKIRNLTSKSKISPQNPKSHLKSTKTCNNGWRCFKIVLLWSCSWSVFHLLRDVSSETLTCVQWWSKPVEVLFCCQHNYSNFFNNPHNLSNSNVFLQKTDETSQHNPNS